MSLYPKIQFLISYMHKQTKNLPAYDITTALLYLSKQPETEKVTEPI